MKKAWFVISTTILILFFLLPSIITSPNSYMLSNEGDGLKNYYNASYYVKYDSGVHFSGLQYPYGTHIVYTDNQPLISYNLNLLKRYTGIDLSNYVVGIFNYAILLSIVLCALFLYLILIHFAIPFEFALVFALLITFMNPQMHRLSGHYALSYAFFIPVLWYMLLKKDQCSVLKSFSTVYIFLLFMAFLHPYFILIGAVFIMAYWGIYILYNKSQFAHYKYTFFAYFSAVLLAIASFQGIVKITDPILDRPQSPWGLMSYRAVFEGLFIPNEGIIHDHIEPYFDNNFMKLFFDLEYQSVESNVYLGFIGLLFLAFLLSRIIVLLKRKRGGQIINPVLPKELSIALYCSFIVLLFAMAYPFRLGMDFLLDIISPLKQFRSLGRFAWVFYYIFSVGMCYYTYLIYRILKQDKTSYALTLIIIITGIWSFETIDSLGYTIPKPVENLFVDSYSISKKIPINSQNYQAILTLPLYLAGTEKIDMEGSDTLKREASILSYQLHLPLISGDLSRTSISAGQKLRQVASNPIIDKPIYKDLTPNDSLLIIVNKEDISNYDSILLKHAQFIEKYSSVIDLYRITPSEIINIHNSLQATLINNYSINTNTTNSFILQSFDEHVTNDFFCGKGSFVFDATNNNSIVVVLPKKMGGKNLEISFWTKLNYERAGTCLFDFTMSKFSSKLWQHTGWLTDYKDIDKGWILVKQDIKVPLDGCTLTIQSNWENVIIDELLIREKNKNVYTQIQSGRPLLFNNYLLEKK